MNDSIIDLSNQGMDEIGEETFLPKGEEVEVRLISITKNVDKNGTDYLAPYMEVINHEDADNIPEISDYIPLPEKNETAKANNKRKRKLNSFAACFNFSWDRPIQFSEMRGLTGFIVVGYKEDDEYGPKNTVSKYVSGH